MNELADWSNLPKDIYVIGARGDGIAFDVSCCSVPMVAAPEVRYTRADLAIAHIRKLEAALIVAIDGLEDGLVQYASRTYHGSRAAADEQYPWIARMMKAQDTARAALGRKRDE